MTLKQTLDALRKKGNKRTVEGMKRFGITDVDAYGVSVPDIRSIARLIKKDHALARSLWESDIHEARILAVLIADPDHATLSQMDTWTRGMRNWAQCDAACGEFFQRTRSAETLPERWCRQPKEFVRRAGFVMMASIAVHHKKLDDHIFEDFFPLIIEYSIDERNFVRKGVNWALRQIGKRNLRLHKKAIALSKEIQNISSPTAQWIAADALRELNDPKTIALVHRRKGVV
ncbi:MAG: DNA alkylation repair protein [Bacteroidetes bacterium]|nr:DNA alkylation repair protein [Bacteroidota bacterium]